MNIVLDANLVASLVLPLPYSEATTVQFLAWKRQQITFIAPALWNYEVSTILHKAVAMDYLPAAKLNFAMEQFWQINIQDVPATLELQQRALTWAERLGQSKTYDGAYLAAAETLNAEFWTADHRLTRSAHQTGATWVHSIFETTDSD